MKNFLTMIACAAMMASGLTACSDDDDDDADDAVAITKTTDKAILLCTFGSTFKGPQDTYDQIVKEYKAKYPDYDVYLAFTSRTCVSRVGAQTGRYYAQPDLWLKAMGEAGYKTIGVQSLHVIPGEEYLSLMNTDVKKNFMTVFPDVKVAKGACLLEGDGTEQEKANDIEAVAEVLYNQFCKKLVEKGEYVLFTGHGNPESEYNHANSRYSQLEQALQELDGNRKRIFVGTVDYGDMMFSYIREQLAANVPAGATLHLAPVMSVAGDHAHNDMAGDLEQGQTMDDVNPMENDHEAEFSWKLKLRKLGYVVPDENCHMVGLGDYEGLRKQWMGHLDMSTAESWNEHLGE